MTTVTPATTVIASLNKSEDGGPATTVKRDFSKMVLAEDAEGKAMKKQLAAASGMMACTKIVPIIAYAVFAFAGVDGARWGGDYTTCWVASKSDVCLSAE